ncbi:MAG: hypothetical protein AAF602_28730, partial [Myxococcota bacterium]
VVATVVAQMFEEESCDNDDLDKTLTTSTDPIPAGSSVQVASGWQETEEWPDDDRFEITLQVTNEAAQP